MIPDQLQAQGLDGKGVKIGMLDFGVDYLLVITLQLLKRQLTSLKVIQHLEAALEPIVKLPLVRFRSSLRLYSQLTICELGYDVINNCKFIARPS